MSTKQTKIKYEGRLGGKYICVGKTVDEVFENNWFQDWYRIPADRKSLRIVKITTETVWEPENE